jgi:hypothetical protein
VLTLQQHHSTETNGNSQPVILSLLYFSIILLSLIPILSGATKTNKQINASLERTNPEELQSKGQ